MKFHEQNKFPLLPILARLYAFMKFRSCIQSDYFLLFDIVDSMFLFTCPQRTKPAQGQIFHATMVWNTIGNSSGAHLVENQITHSLRD